MTIVLFVSFNVLETMFFSVQIPQVLDDPHRCLHKNKKITKCMSETLNYYDDKIFGNHIVTNDQRWHHLNENDTPWIDNMQILPQKKVIS